MKQLISHTIRVQLFDARGVIQQLHECDVADHAVSRNVGRMISQWLAAEEGNKVVSTTVRIVRVDIS